MTIVDKCFENEHVLIVRDMEIHDRTTAAAMLARAVKANAFPEDFLPETGVVVEHCGRVICIIPVYMEATSNVAVLGHFIADVSANRKLVAKAAKLAIEAAAAWAKKQGRKYVISIFGRNSINRIADKLGFITTEIIEEKIYHQ